MQLNDSTLGLQSQHFHRSLLILPSALPLPPNHLCHQEPEIVPERLLPCYYHCLSMKLLLSMLERTSHASGTYTQEQEFGWFMRFWYILRPQFVRCAIQQGYSTGQCLFLGALLFLGVPIVPWCSWVFRLLLGVPIVPWCSWVFRLLLGVPAVPACCTWLFLGVLAVPQYCCCSWVFLLSVS